MPAPLNAVCVPGTTINHALVDPTALAGAVQLKANGLPPGLVVGAFTFTVQGSGGGAAQILSILSK